MAAYRRTTPLSPDSKQRLLDRIAAMPPPQRGRWMALRWMPFETRVSPIVAAAALVSAFVLGATLTRIALAPRLDHASPVARVSAPADSLIPVQFVLFAPGARSVTVAGDFNHWDAGNLAMARMSPEGLWTVTTALARGSYRYSFVIDGRRWVTDPTAALGPDDGLGPGSSVVVVEESKAI